MEAELERVNFDIVGVTEKDNVALLLDFVSERDQLLVDVADRVEVGVGGGVIVSDCV